MELAERTDQRVEVLRAARLTSAAPGVVVSISPSILPTSRDVAQVLGRMGLKEGDAIAVWLEPGSVRFRLLLGAALAGVSAVPIAPAEPLLNVRRTLRAWKVRLLVIPQDDDGYDYLTAARALVEVHPELRWVDLGDFPAD